ncbi:hypothetical protein IIM_01993 [Bacillus cereus VD107]|nr:hypothetical protein IIM_01993 [Bacillus cereus VD107]
MTAEEPLFSPEIHGGHGLGPIIPPKMRICDRENFCELIKLIEPCPEDIIIVATGRLTTLATLFLLYPNLMNRVCSYYIMAALFYFRVMLHQYRKLIFMEIPLQRISL